MKSSLPTSALPHHRLIAYRVAVELLQLILDAQIRDRKLRDEGRRAAMGACLNIAEGAARATRADKARAYIIARGEVVESVAALEIAEMCGVARAELLPRVSEVAGRLVGMLAKLGR